MSLREPKPIWLRRRVPAVGSQAKVSGLVHQYCLHTVCQEAECPNQMECYGQGTATFLLLGPSCTRRCTFCAVDKGRIRPADPEEPEHVAEAVGQMGLDFCVLTMCTRDDLSDGGGGHVAQTIEALRQRCPGVGVEVLISDLGGSRPALEEVLGARPEVLNHNVETVPRLYPEVRPQADYQRSLELLSRAARHTPRPATKSGLMLGLGETKAEVLQVMDDLRSADCDLLTIGQYLAPSENHHPVVRYVPPDEFEELKTEALKRGFKAVASAPLVRSSYRASHLYRAAVESS
jgi:lipoic acid synthetase